VTQYDPTTVHHTFRKLKAETRGYPSLVQTPDVEDGYIESFWQSHGVRLNKDAIEYIAAKRGFAKLCLNSMCGKMGERAQRPQTKLILKPKELYSFLATPDFQVSNMFANDDVVWISCQNSEKERVPTLKHSNDVIDSYVTADARIHLYSNLDRLRNKALYCDTDSVVYIQPRNEPGLVETWYCLGAMTSELKPDENISEFVGAGLKYYAYKTGEHKTVCKVRGITLNYNAFQLVNFDKIKEMIFNRLKRMYKGAHEGKN
jgi:hypothetical protein